jgi:glycosyltransferase involved in cell wall biosynthesis
MSNILVNIPDLSKEYGGVYQYSVALLKILAERKLPHEFFIFCHDPDPAIIEIIDKYSNFHNPKPPTLPYFRGEIFFHTFLNRLFRRLKLKRRFYKEDVYDWLIEKLNIDIIHTPYQFNIKKQGIKSITTLHDVQELHFPEFFTAAQRAHRAVNYKKAIDEADAVVVSYDHVKKDIIKYFKKPEEKVFTVLLDMQKLWFENTQKTLFLNIEEKYNLPSKFILYPAATWQHKNHLKLIEAIEYLDDPKIQLICTGNLTENYYNNILTFIEEKKLSNQIKFLGIVTDEELLNLYRKCRAVVVPTLYEAGSFPLMESILMGIPVICSNVTSLPETIGDSRFVFDPINIHDIADKIKKIWADDFYRNENKVLLKIQAEKIKDNNAASKMNKIYESLFTN